MSKKREVNIIVDAKNKSKATFLEVKKDLKGLGDASKEGLGKLGSAFDKADKVVYSFADRMKFMDKTVKRTFQGAAAATAVYVGSTLKDFSQLNDGISKVNTLYDQTGESQKKMYQDSMKMFGLMPTDFNQITDAMYNAISAGGDPEHAAMFARKFGMAGVAGDADMDVVTKAAMGTMNAYKAEAQDLDKILDLQFTTVKEGITSYDELASSLGTGVLASAKSAGITMEELYGSIALITKNAIPASVATTSLNQMFNKFTDTKVIKEFKAYGVEIQDANRNTRPLIEIFKDLNNQFDRRKMSSEQRKGFLKELVGSEQAARAITPLLGDLKELDRILGSMDNSSGTMKDAYSDRMESMKLQIQTMWNGLKSVGIEQIEKMNPLIEAVTGPWIEKNKIELEIMDLEDSLKLTDDPIEKELIAEEVNRLQIVLDDIDLTPVDEFREALSESVVELDKFSPAIGGVVDKLGNFILDFVGEEGKDNRDKAGKIGKTIGGTWLLSKGLRMFKDIAGKTPWEVGKAVVPKVLGAGKGIMETGYLKGALGMDLLKSIGIGGGTAGIMSLPFLAAGGAMYKEHKDNKKSKEILDNPKDYSYNSSNKKYVTKAEMEDYNKKTIEQDRQNNVTIGPATNASNSKVDKKSEDTTNYGASILAALKELSSKNPKIEKDVPKEELSFPKNYPYNNIDIGPVLKDLSNMKSIEERIENNIEMKSDISVEAPKVNVKMYVDGANIPVQKVEVDYKKVDKYTEIQSRRFGRPQI